MTELEKVRQFVKENGNGQKYVRSFDHKWKGYNVYVWYFVTPYEFTGRYPLTVLVKDGKISQATEKEIDQIRVYQSQFYVKDDKYGDGKRYLDMQSLNILAERFYPELKEKMKTCSDERELNLFCEELDEKWFKNMTAKNTEK